MFKNLSVNQALMNSRLLAAYAALDPMIPQLRGEIRFSGFRVI